jgi:signal transduction histidine kinase
MNKHGIIMVVDDSSESLTYLARLLTKEGHEVRAADGGQPALTAAIASPPDLILLDIRMPEMDGFEVCRRLKACESTREIPVLFTSAAGEVMERLEGLRLGAVDYVTKPFEPEELLARVRTHLELHRLQERLKSRLEDRETELRQVNAQLKAELLERERASQLLHKLEAQNHQLQKSESLGRMAGAIAHHFNNSLMAVMMNLELARGTLPADSDALDLLAEALGSARAAAELSGLMLTYLGQTHEKQQPVDLSETCNRCLPRLRSLLQGPVLLETDLPLKGPALHANRSQLEKILAHLVTNAWEAIGDRQGTIKLRVGTAQAGAIPESHRFPVDWQPQCPAFACLEVEDTGCGIAESDFDKIFDPFFSSKFTGRGLGLPVTLGIARAHGGAVTVESRPAHGSIFRVWLPLLP